MTDKTHIISSHKEYLEKGTFHEYGDKILPCLFSGLVDFVECDLAMETIRFNEEAQKKYNYKYNFFKVWRNKEAACEYLNWSKNLKYDENCGVLPDDPLYGKPTKQAEYSKEIEYLYSWWTVTRPKRKDPYVISGFSEYNKKKHAENNSVLNLMTQRTEKERKLVRKMLKDISRIQKQYFDEDTKMLTRLIKIRQGFWS